jgi:hypothetical protein
VTKKQKTLAVVGVVALAAVVVGGVAYAKSQNQLPGGGAAPAAPTMTPATTFAKGGNYGFAAQLPAGTTDQATLIAGLQGIGWTNVQVQFFGPTANGGNPPAGLPFTVPAPLNTAYVASGTWTGADGTAVGANIVAVRVS